LKAAGKDPEAIKAQKMAELEQSAQAQAPQSDAPAAGAFDFSNFLGAGSYAGKSNRDEDDTL
ncbi:MAG TPA: hypothetical protein PLO23_10845, partial [Alphaproteobacteria bacterium]|nr:hypothetical protein [Alphaproteobacteria bacterium]